MMRGETGKMSDIVDTSKKPDTITIIVDGVGKAATYSYKGDYVDADGNINYKDELEGEVQIQFKVQSKGNDVSFYTWPKTASSLYIDGVPAGEERGQFKNYKKQDSKWLVIDDLNDDKATYDYTIWLTDGKIHWPLDPTIQNN